MINRLPADVPDSDVIYDLTLTGAGLDRRKREICLFVIDNGKFKGTRVSTILIADLKEALIRDADVPVEKVSTRGLSDLKLQVRLSAHIRVERLAKGPGNLFFQVDDEYKDSNVYVVYHMTNFSYPNSESEMVDAFKRKDGKFERNNDPQPPPEKPVEETPPEKKETPKPRARRKKKTTPNK